MITRSPDPGTFRYQDRVGGMERPGMATVLAAMIAPDHVISFEINPGTLLQFLEARAEGGPRLKCFEGSVTLVSPGMPHDVTMERLSFLILAICMELGIRRTSLRSTTWYLPLGARDTAYEPDAAYYLGRHGQVGPDQPPDLAVEIVVTNPATKALQAGALVGIPELWVLDIPRRRLTFHHLATRGKHKGTYRPAPRSRAFPVLNSSEVLEQLDNPETDDIILLENFRAWARRVLVPRLGADTGGDR
jgi:Uma2 family endonuclease